jgi:hypothetical protein
METSFEAIDNLIQGIVLISGLPGSGKTTAAMTITRPNDLVVLDFDLKDELRCKTLDIPYYRPEMPISQDPTENDLEEILNWSRATFSDIAEKGKAGHSTLVIDNGSPLEDAFSYAVMKNPAKYGVNPRNAQTGAYGGVNPGVSVLWHNTVRFFQSSGFRRIVVCMHMSQSWANGVPVEKMKVKGNRALTQLSNLSVVLVRSNHPNQPPSGLVGKEALGLLHWNDATHKYSINMALPPRVPAFTWDSVVELNRQMESGQKQSFSEKEIWTPREIEQYSPWLSDGQREFILTIARNPGFHLEEGDGFVSEKPVSGPLEDLDKKDDPKDWDGLVQYARITYGIDIDGLKRYIRNEFGVFKNADIAKYVGGLRNLSVGNQETCPG